MGRIFRQLVFSLSLMTTLVAIVAGPSAASQNRPHPGDVGPAATPGSFVLQSCGESGSALGWSLDAGEATFIAGADECPPKRGNEPSMPSALSQTGLWLTDFPGDDGGPVFTPEDAERTLTFSVVPGTTITRVRYWRLVAKSVDGDWHPFVALNDGLAQDSCEFSG